MYGNCSQRNACDTTIVLMTDSLGRHVLLNIKAELARRDRSQSELAGELGMTGASLSRRLSGRVDITMGELLAFAAALDVSVEEFFRPAPDAVAS